MGKAQAIIERPANPQVPIALLETTMAARR